jgi:Tetratricopeptide repeat
MTSVAEVLTVRWWVAQKALQVAEQNVGPDRPDVATSLNNLAALYRATKRNAEAEALEKRAARIRAIKR